VVGGGNSAVEEALYLSHIASKVTLVHRRDTLRAERILQERLAARPNVEFRWNSAIDEILGSENPLSVEAVRLKNIQTGATETIVADGVFVAIGHKPATELFAGQIDLKPMAISRPHRIRPRPISKASSPPVTWPTTNTVRP